MNQKKDPAIYEKQKAKQELKDCTFKPQIDKKSSRMASEMQNLTPSYEILHRK
jgi:type III secretory pathway component EscU